MSADNTNSPKRPRRAAEKKSTSDQKNSKNKLITITAALTVLLTVIVVVLYALFARQGSGGHGGFQPGKPTWQDASCPDIEFISIPGTWESSRDEDPFHPHKFPRALLMPMTRALASKYPQSRVETYTIPYVAQFRNSKNPQDETYENSRKEGAQKTEARLQEVHANCPLTKFIMVGFSQGAVIAGDVANEIGTKGQPVPSDSIALIGLISDGRRIAHSGNDVGPSPLGDGAEVSYAGLNTDNLAKGGLNILGMFNLDGIVLRGARPGGFGDIKDRTLEFCAPDDIICDSPKISLDNPLQQLQKLLGGFQPIHASYGTTKYWSYQSKSATVWLTGKVESVIDSQPHVAHHK